MQIACHSRSRLSDWKGSNSVLAYSEFEAVSASALENLAREVLRVRFAQLWVNEHLKVGGFKVPVHLALGHEAIAVAVRAAMVGSDSLCLSHRNVHYNLASADNLDEELAELMLEPGGIAGGQSGSMNMANPAKGIPYTSSILGNDLSVATGIALADKLARRDTVTFAVTGDGAMEEGAFYEAIELLKSLGLPAIIIVENNGWSLGSRIGERRCAIDLKAIAVAFDISYNLLSGNDVQRYAAQLTDTRQMAIMRECPAIIEVELSTLGDWRGNPIPEEPDGKFINYHHGPARTIDIDAWPIIQEDDRDPVHVLSALLAGKWLRDCANNLFRDLPKVSSH